MNQKYKTERQARDAMVKRHSAWQKKNCRNVMLRFFLKSDADVIAKLDSVPNKTEYVRSLILKDIKGE